MSSSRKLIPLEVEFKPINTTITVQCADYIECGVQEADMEYK